MNTADEDTEIKRMIELKKDFKKTTDKYGQYLKDQVCRPVEADLHNEHYGDMRLEPLDVAQQWLSNEHLEGAYLFQIIKYLGRYRMNKPGKGGKTDLYKMRDYLNLLIEMKNEG